MAGPDPSIALVTGASRGLGAAMVEALAARGWHVVAVARTSGALEELDDRVSAAGGTATLAPMDVTEDAAMRQLCRSIFDRWGRLDLWVHTAIHAPPLSPADHIDMAELERAFAVNLHAAARLIGFTAPLLAVAPAGAALFPDDPHPGEKFFGAYAASKAAQMAVVEAWRAETARHGPRILRVRPAPMPTATRARFFPGEPREPLADPAAEARRLLDEAGLA